MDRRSVVPMLVLGLLASGGVVGAAVGTRVPAAAVDVAARPSAVRSEAAATTVTRRDGGGTVTFELTGKDVSVRKTFDGKSAVTTLAQGRERVTYTVTGTSVSIEAGGRTWRGSAEAIEALEPAAAFLRTSPVFLAARALLDRTALRHDVVRDNALLLTKVFLAAMAGDETPAHEYQAWAKTAAATRPKIVKAGFQFGPGDCWDLYELEALRIADSYWGCAQACHFRGWWCMNVCGALYILRAEGAFMWYMKCNGGFYVNG